MNRGSLLAFIAAVSLSFIFVTNLLFALLDAVGAPPMAATLVVSGFGLVMALAAYTSVVVAWTSRSVANDDDGRALTTNNGPRTADNGCQCSLWRDDDAIDLIAELVVAVEALRASHTEWCSEAEIAAALDLGDNAIDRARAALAGKEVRP